jgi:predicted transposase YbfD/YdcC
MAKLFNPILEYRDIITSTGIEIENDIPTKKTIKRFVRLFKQIDDKRIEKMTYYPLSEILLIAFLAILGGAGAWTEIESFGLAKEKWLKKFLKLEHGIPSHDTIRRVFSLVNSIQLETATVKFLMENMAGIKKSLKIKASGPRLICVDGKEENGTGRKYGTTEEVRNMQILHVFDASSEICLFSRSIDKKTNEIPVAQEVLKTLQLNDCIVSFDALHTQKETIKIIIEQKGNYVGALKNNQGSLHTTAENLFTLEVKSKIKKELKNFYESKEKAHNQIEHRRFYMIKATQPFSKEPWAKLRNFICYEKYTQKIITGQESIEIRYYMTSLNDITLCAESIRGHWSVENKLHWHLDKNFGEDDNTTTDKNAFNNFSILNKMVLSICKLIQPFMKKLNSIRLIKKGFHWAYEDQLSLVLTLLDEEVLKNALVNANNSKN